MQSRSVALRSKREESISEFQSTSGGKLQHFSKHSKQIYRNPLKRVGGRSTVTTSVTDTTKPIEKTESDQPQLT